MIKNTPGARTKKEGDRTMMAQQRFEQILAYVNRRRAASVAELCAATGASEADVRTKAQLQVPQKDAIARYAAAQVTDEDLVFLDAGTTTLHMVEYLDASRATFVTNGVACARRLVEKGLRAYVLGGLLKPRTEAVVGGVALEMMANYNFTKAFLGTNGISMQRGYTTPDTEEACIKEKAVQRAFASYVLADSTKFGKAAAITVCPLEKARIITDSLPDESYRRYTVIEEVQV